MADVTLSSIVGGASGSLPSATEVLTREAGALALITGQGGAFTASATPSAWVTVLDVSNPGILFWATVRQGNTTSKTVGLRITIDGVVAGSVTRAAASASATNGVIAGAVSDPINSSAYASGGFAPFQSLKIEVNSSAASDTAATWNAMYVLL